MTIKQEQKLQNAVCDYRFKLLEIHRKIGEGDLKSEKYCEMFIGDLSDHIHLCNLIINEQYNKASFFIASLDSESEEQIPRFIFNTIYDYKK